jgi:ribose 5-phosphate isomerase B
MSTQNQPIALASDHAGYPLKEYVKEILEELNISYTDFGTNSTESCDYPDFASKAACSISKGDCAQGIFCCGSGVGVSIVANKIPGIRAALCHDEESSKLAREHNNANVLCMGARVVERSLAKKMVEAWLNANFEGGRHERRVEKISLVEANKCSSR